MLCGVLDKHAHTKCGHSDVFVSAAGGVRITDPAADLGMCVAIASSWRDQPAPPATAFIGEVGLGGEVRPVPFLDRRIAEAFRFGLDCVVVPASAKEAAVAAAGERCVTPVGCLGDVLDLLSE
jgi:DNA repair protein RadA/Sms